MTQPIPRPGGSASVSRSGGSLSSRGPGTPNYQPTELIGLDRLPDAIFDELCTAKIIILPTLVEWVDEAVAKRRQDGSHYQQMDAWWASCSELNLVTVRRELEPEGKGRLRPRGTWVASGTSYRLPHGLVAEHSVWRFQPSAGPATDAASPKTDDPLDLLPNQLTAPIAGGEAHASLSWGERWAREEVIAYRLMESRVRILHANREATSRRKLLTTDWTAETLDAPLVGKTPVSARGPQPGQIHSNRSELPETDSRIAPQRP